MDKTLEEKYEELEKRMTALEGQAQPTIINLNMNLQDSCFVDYLIQCIIQYHKMHERINEKTKHSAL
jgi:uncharacterized protein involved in tolerance to divalent cations